MKRSSSPVTPYPWPQVCSALDGGEGSSYLASGLPTISDPELEEVPHINPTGRGQVFLEDFPLMDVLAPLSPKVG